MYALTATMYDKGVSDLMLIRTVPSTILPSISPSFGGVNVMLKSLVCDESTVTLVADTEKALDAGVERY
jgi:hypothetical protein